MSVGSGSFGAANWAAVSDRAVPGESGRYLALANLGTAGAAAAAGLLAPLVDRGGGGFGGGYAALYVVCAALFVAAAVVVIIDARRADLDLPVPTSTLPFTRA
jgi:MFS family permease